MVSWRKEGGREGARIQAVTQAPTSMPQQTAVGHIHGLTLTPTQPSQSCVYTGTHIQDSKYICKGLTIIPRYLAVGMRPPHVHIH